MNYRCNPIEIHRLEMLVEAWRLTLNVSFPSLHPLDIATALENVAKRIRNGEAGKVKDGYEKGYIEED